MMPLMKTKKLLKSLQLDSHLVNAKKHSSLRLSIKDSSSSSTKMLQLLPTYNKLESR